MLLLGDPLGPEVVGRPATAEVATRQALRAPAAAHRARGPQVRGRLLPPQRLGRAVPGPGARWGEGLGAILSAAQTPRSSSHLSNPDSGEMPSGLEVGGRVSEGLFSAFLNNFLQSLGFGTT